MLSVSSLDFCYQASSLLKVIPTFETYKQQRQVKWEKQHLNNPSSRATIQDLDGLKRDKCHCYERTQHERSQTTPID